MRGINSLSRLGGGYNECYSFKRQRGTGTDETVLSNTTHNAFQLTSEQQEFLDLADRFAHDKLWPLQQRMDDEEWWPPDLMPSLGEMGFLGVTAAERHGGANSDVFTSGLITQGLARWNPAAALSYIAH